MYFKSMNNEFIHVSQFYQTVLVITVFTFSTLLLVAFCLNLLSHLQLDQKRQYEDECKWSQISQEKIIQKESQQKMLQQSVNIQIQNQITNMEKNQAQELKQIKHVQQPNKQQQVSQRKSVNELDNKDLKIQQPKAKINQLIKIQQKVDISERRKTFIKFLIALNGFISQNLAILMPVILIGILTKSTYVFSLAAFFCALFCSVIFDFLRLQEQLKQQHKRGIVVRRVVKILSSLLVLSILFSYWIVIQFNN